ncbi:hypothetical protein OG809_39120 [Kribbella soli]
MTTLMDYQQRTGRTDLRWIVNEMFEKNQDVFPAGQKSDDALEGNFISRAIDDTAWVGHRLGRGIRPHRRPPVRMGSTSG